MATTAEPVAAARTAAAAVLDARALARELAGAIRGEVRFSPGTRALYANDASVHRHSIIAGVTADNIESLDVLLYDGTRLQLPSAVSEEELERTIAAGGRVGQIYARLRDLRDRYADLIRERYPDIPRRISGYNLDRLLPEHGFNLAAAMVGTEATCALVLEARCKLIPSPQCRSLVLVGYRDGPVAADQVPEVMEYHPIGLEMFDRRLVRNEEILGRQRRTDLLPKGDAWLLVEFGADREDEVDERAERFCQAVRGGAAGPSLGVKLYEDEAEIAQVWEIREGGLAGIPGGRRGRTPRWRRSGSATICATSRRCVADTGGGSRACSATSATAAFTPGSTGIS